MTMTPTQAVEVQRKKLAACMTCPLCSKLFRDATTITECLHTFCRNCIYMKIMEEYADQCPVCNIDLGCAPLEKLRADNSMQDLRNKIFPQEKKTESEASIPLPIRRKEISLSSLGIKTARKLSHLGVNARKAKSYARKNIALRRPIISVEDINTATENEKKENVDTANLCPKPPAINDRPPKFDPSNQPVPIEVIDIDESCVEKTDLWKSLNSLADIATRTRSGKTIVLEDDAVEIITKEPQGDKAKKFRHKRKGHGFIHKSFVDENGQTSKTSDPSKPRLKADQKKWADKSKILNIPAQAVVDISTKPDRQFCPIWFSLNACHKEGYAPLPQISSCCLRIRDGNVPVTFIQKYLAKKLDLVSETEVQIFVGGEPMLPALLLNDLVYYWLHSETSSERIQTSVGSRGMEFVMPLSYARNRRSIC